MSHLSIKQTVNRAARPVLDSAPQAKPTPQTHTTQGRHACGAAAQLYAARLSHSESAGPRTAPYRPPPPSAVCAVHHGWGATVGDRLVADNSRPRLPLAVEHNRRSLCRIALAMAATSVDHGTSFENGHVEQTLTSRPLSNLVAELAQPPRMRLHQVLHALTLTNPRSISSGAPTAARSLHFEWW